MNATPAALAKMKSSNSIILRIYSLMRILHENFDYSFVLNKQKRTPKMGLFHYPIKKIINPGMELVYNEDDIDLKGLEKTKYCREKVLDVLIKLLEENGYVFKKAKTNTSRKDHGINAKYPPITTEKLKSVSIKCLGNVKSYNMNDVENTIGSDTYNYLKNKFTEQVTLKECIVCHDYKLSVVSKECTMNYSIIPFPSNNQIIEDVLITANTNEKVLVDISDKQVVSISNDTNTECMNTLIHDTQTIVGNTQLYSESQLTDVNNTVLPEKQDEVEQDYNQFDYNYLDNTASFINNTNCCTYSNYSVLDCNAMELEINDVNNINNVNDVNIMANYNMFNAFNMNYDVNTDEYYHN